MLFQYFRIAELQSALNEEGIGQDGDEDIYHGKLIPDSLRPEVWKNLLAVREQHFYLDDIFDLPEQNVIRQDCQEFVGEIFQMTFIYWILLCFER